MDIFFKNRKKMKSTKTQKQILALQKLNYAYNNYDDCVFGEFISNNLIDFLEQIIPDQYKQKKPNAIVMISEEKECINEMLYKGIKCVCSKKHEQRFVFYTFLERFKYLWLDKIQCSSRKKVLFRAHSKGKKMKHHNDVKSELFLEDAERDDLLMIDYMDQQEISNLKTGTASLDVNNYLTAPSSNLRWPHQLSQLEKHHGNIQFLKDTHTKDSQPFFWVQNEPFYYNPNDIKAIKDKNVLYTRKRLFRYAQEVICDGNLGLLNKEYSNIKPNYFELCMEEGYGKDFDQSLYLDIYWFSDVIERVILWHNDKKKRYSNVFVFAQRLMSMQNLVKLPKTSLKLHVSRIFKQLGIIPLLEKKLKINRKLAIPKVQQKIIIFSELSMEEQIELMNYVKSLKFEEWIFPKSLVDTQDMAALLDQPK